MAKRLNYRERLSRREVKRRAKLKRDKQDRLAYVEPDLRAYEDAYRQTYGTPISLRYARGWCIITTGGANRLMRLDDLRQRTGMMLAAIHERELRNEG